jgi:hypothetical protein
LSDYQKIIKMEQGKEKKQILYWNSYLQLRRDVRAAYKKRTGNIFHLAPKTSLREHCRILNNLFLELGDDLDISTLLKFFSMPEPVPPKLIMGFKGGTVPTLKKFVEKTRPQDEDYIGLELEDTSESEDANGEVSALLTSINPVEVTESPTEMLKENETEHIPPENKDPSGQLADDGNRLTKRKRVLLLLAALFVLLMVTITVIQFKKSSSRQKTVLDPALSMQQSNSDSLKRNFVDPDSLKRRSADGGLLSPIVNNRNILTDIAKSRSSLEGDRSKTRIPNTSLPKTDLKKTDSPAIKLNTPPSKLIDLAIAEFAYKGLTENRPGNTSRININSHPTDWTSHIFNFGDPDSDWKKEVYAAIGDTICVDVGIVNRGPDTAHDTHIRFYQRNDSASNKIYVDILIWCENGSIVRKYFVTLRHIKHAHLVWEYGRKVKWFPNSQNNFHVLLPLESKEDLIDEINLGDLAPNFLSGGIVILNLIVVSD